ncbi:MAG: glycosyltransferase family 2 protein [Anaplasmataceae bacterium]|nr:glycosyltransferase family 2 protein [Anaplasmataceae bacterium]
MNNSSPLFSIIIPAYNEEKIIGKALKDIRNRLTAFPYEIIVVDDGSTDKTVDIARQIADEVLLSPQPEIHLIPRTRNRGGKAARGELIVFMDSGVFINEPNRFFARVVECFKNDPRLVALTVKLRVFPDQATWADRFFFWLVDVYFALVNNILGTGGASGKFMAVRKEAFEKVGGFDERMAVAEDNEFFWRLAKIGKVKIDWSLIAYHGGRRAHAIGWPRLLYEWFRNAWSVKRHGKSADNEWKPIR